MFTTAFAVPPTPSPDRLDEAIGPGRLVILVQQVPDGNLQIQAGDADIADGRTHIETLAHFPQFAFRFYESWGIFGG